jgi:hypothetical protein
MAEALLDVLRAPLSWTSLDGLALERLLRQAARAHITATLGSRLSEAGVRDGLPAAVGDRFIAADVVAAEHERRMRFGLRLAKQVFAGSDIPVIVLKGGAYLLGGFPNAVGRLTSDLDLMVPESRLAEAERLFHQAAWRSQTDDDYDEQYYREWMHELPPLVHPHHGITIDLHHNLSPRTGRLKIDAATLFERAVPLGGDTPFLRLADEDLVLHLCIHLFHDGEFQQGLRELLDLDGVLRHCAEAAGFWPRLLDSATELGLLRSLYYGCHFSAALLDTPVPDTVQQQLAAATPRTPGQRLAQAAMAVCLLPMAGDTPTLGRRLAEGMLLLRAHWLRMPPGLLLRHLFTQVRRRGGLKTKEAARQP